MGISANLAIITALMGEIYSATEQIQTLTFQKTSANNEASSLQDKINMVKYQANGNANAEIRLDEARVFTRGAGGAGWVAGIDATAPASTEYLGQDGNYTSTMPTTVQGFSGGFAVEDTQMNGTLGGVTAGSPFIRTIAGNLSTPPAGGPARQSTRLIVSRAATGNETVMMWGQNWGNQGFRISGNQVFAQIKNILPALEGLLRRVKAKEQFVDQRMEKQKNRLNFAERHLDVTRQFLAKAQERFFKGFGGQQG